MSEGGPEGGEEGVHREEKANRQQSRVHQEPQSRERMGVVKQEETEEKEGGEEGGAEREEGRGGGGGGVRTRKQQAQFSKV